MLFLILYTNNFQTLFFSKKDTSPLNHGGQMMNDHSVVPNTPSTNTVVFDGHFTPEVIELFKLKMKQFSLSKRDISNLVDCHETTVLKWLSGKITRCRISNVPILRLLLSNAIDSALLKASYQAVITHKHINMRDFLEKNSQDIPEKVLFPQEIS